MSAIRTASVTRNRSTARAYQPATGTPCFWRSVSVSDLAASVCGALEDQECHAPILGPCGVIVTPIKGLGLAVTLRGQTLLVHTLALHVFAHGLRAAIGEVEVVRVI